MAAAATEEQRVKWREAGRVGADALLLGRSLCVPGARLVDVVHQVEESIRARGLGLAFPCTLSLNSLAAHFTPPAGDETVLVHGDLVKVDCGAELDGALSDNALTIEVGYPKDDGPNARLIECSRACLKEAIGIVGPNVDLGTVGAAIEMTAKEFGFRPIQNLTGHSLERFNLHAGLTVPNVKMRIMRRPRIGDVLACEPFVTPGVGRVDNSGPGNIYHYQRSKPVRMDAQRRLMAAIEKRHPLLPFAQRWLAETVEAGKLSYNLQALQREAILKHYPALSESSGALVAQTEATLIVTESGCEVTTQPSK